MSNADVHLVRKAFLINYGYSPDLSHHAMMCEFLRRYDQAHALHRKNAGFHRVMLVIEGMAETLSDKEASSERELRKLKIERLSDESGYSPIELDLLAEEFVARLEAEWISSNGYFGGLYRNY